MVNVAASSDVDALKTETNSMIKHMLKQREAHAKQQKHDYSHVFRKRTKFEIFRLATIGMSIELAYAMEASFVSPILLEIGLDHKIMTMAWGLAPLLGFFLSPLLGSMSDRCHLKMGRRRPFITLLSFNMLVGLILVPYGKEFGLLLGDKGYTHNLTTTVASNFSDVEGSAAALHSAEQGGGPSNTNFKYATILTIIGLVLLDFDADTCQTPARTYLLDMCVPEDQPKTLTAFTFLAGVGGIIGFGLGGIDFEQTRIGTFLGGNRPTVFFLVTIIFIVCYFITVTTFREIPLKLIEKDEMLRPLSDAVIKRELKKANSNIYYIAQAEIDGKCSSVKGYQNGNSVHATNSSSSNANVSTEGHIQLKQNSSTTKTITGLDDIEGEKSIPLSQYFKSIFVMPTSMRILALTNLLCCMCQNTYTLNFTDFVGEAVFNGDPTAPPNSDAANLYEAGVRYGCFGMSVYAFSCSVYSLTVTKLIKWFGTKAVYISGIVYYGVGMFTLSLEPTKWGVFFCSTSVGVLHGTLYTIPFILVANYHTNNCFGIRNGEPIALKNSRGLGTDISIISSVMFIAEFIVAVSMGPIVAWMETTCAISYVGTVLSALAAISAMFVFYV